MSSYYILDTQAESDTCRDEAYQAHIAVHNNPAYVAGTIQWSKEQTRLTDGKYIVPVCEDYANQNSYPVEESSSDWFSQGVEA